MFQAFHVTKSTDGNAAVVAADVSNVGPQARRLPKANTTTGNQSTTPTNNTCSVSHKQTSSGIHTQPALVACYEFMKKQKWHGINYKLIKKAQIAWYNLVNKYQCSMT